MKMKMNINFKVNLNHILMENFLNLSLKIISLEHSVERSNREGKVSRPSSSLFITKTSTNIGLGNIRKD